MDDQIMTLYDYTKFHIGIYLSAAGGLAALIVAGARDHTLANVGAVIKHPWALALSLLFLILRVWQEPLLRRRQSIVLAIRNSSLRPKALMGASLGPAGNGSKLNTLASGPVWSFSRSRAWLPGISGTG